MSVGGSVSAVFGDPGAALRTRMVEVGNYFQEISYAARDLKCGQLSLQDAFCADDASSDESIVSVLTEEGAN